MRLIQFLEAKQVGLLYHYTNLGSAYDILKDNLFRSTTGPYSADYKENTISFTRNKNYHSAPNMKPMIPMVRLTFDGDKISNHYKTQPVAGGLMRNTWSKKGPDVDEAEQVVFAMELPVYPYLIRVDLNITLIDRHVIWHLKKGDYEHLWVNSLVEQYYRILANGAQERIDPKTWLQHLQNVSAEEFGKVLLSPAEQKGVPIGVIEGKGGYTQPVDESITEGVSDSISIWWNPKTEQALSYPWSDMVHHNSMIEKHPEFFGLDNLQRKNSYSSILTKIFKLGFVRGNYRAKSKQLWMQLSDIDNVVPFVVWARKNIGRIDEVDVEIDEHEFGFGPEQIDQILMTGKLPVNEGKKGKYHRSKIYRLRMPDGGEDGVLIGWRADWPKNSWVEFRGPDYTKWGGGQESDFEKVHDSMKGWHTSVLHSGETVDIIPSHPDYEKIKNAIETAAANVAESVDSVFESAVNELTGYHVTQHDVDEFHPLTHFGSPESAEETFKQKGLRFEPYRTYRANIDMKNPAIMFDRKVPHRAMDIVDGMLDLYGGSTEAMAMYDGARPGNFSDEELEALKDEWYERGSFVEFGDEEENEKQEDQRKKDLVWFLKSHGHDGIKYINRQEGKGTWSYISLSPVKAESRNRS